MKNQFLKSLDNLDGIFHQQLQKIPNGKYAHIVVLRETKSYDIFQTDGELNVATVRKGLIKESREKSNRIVMFKRKQTTPERLEGRKELREKKIKLSDLIGKINNQQLKTSFKSYLKVSGNDKLETQDTLMSNCDYNNYACKICPDCIIYGFAIGESGSERSKVLTDSAFSISTYENSHFYGTFNGLFENGTMHKYEPTKNTVTQSTSINSKDHTNPEIFFPSIITIKDPTELSFLYVLSSIMGTKRYGAQITRTGTMENHIIGIVFSNREIFSNLKLTQSIYDNLQDKEKFDLFDVQEATIKSINDLLSKEPLDAKKIFYNMSDYETLNNEILELTQNNTKYLNFIEKLTEETIIYSLNNGVLHLKDSSSKDKNKKESKDE